MDIGISQINGIEAAQRILRIVPQTKIVFLTQEPAQEMVEHATNRGASAYILKSDAEVQLLSR